MGPIIGPPITFSYTAFAIGIIIKNITTRMEQSAFVHGMAKDVDPRSACSIKIEDVYVNVLADFKWQIEKGPFVGLMRAPVPVPVPVPALEEMEPVSKFIDRNI